MKFCIWRNNNWQKRLILFATVIVILSIASHPELRLLIPVIDVLGLDVFIIVVGLQSLSVVSPFASFVYDRAFLPAGALVYRSVLFMFGYMGPYVAARIASRQSGNRV